jgi:putative endonuclease
VDEILSITQTGRRERPSLGEVGERIAVDHLLTEGYRIVMTNFKVPVGRNSKGVAVTGEIDVIALDGGTLCFVEVKTRRSEEFKPVETAVDLRKQRQIARTAKIYRRLFNIWDMRHRYDVVTVLMPEKATPRVTVLRDYWNDARFKKRSWGDTWLEQV